MDTRVLFIAALAVCVITMIPNRVEKFTEWFDHGEPSREVVLEPDEINLNAYEEFEPKITHDLMSKMVLATNFAVQKRLRVPTFVIETTAVKAYRHKDNEADVIYDIQYMLMKQTGFAHGFSVTSTIEVKDDGARVEVVSLRTQPIDVNSPAETAVYESMSTARAHVDYDKVLNFDLKNNGQV